MSKPAEMQARGHLLVFLGEEALSKNLKYIYIFPLPFLPACLPCFTLLPAQLDLVPRLRCSQAGQGAVSFVSQGLRSRSIQDTVKEGAQSERGVKIPYEKVPGDIALEEWVGVCQAYWGRRRKKSLG